MSDLNAATVSNTKPSVCILACGGAGINMVRAAMPQIGERATYQYLDTSRANVTDEEVVRIVGGGGSGKVRGHNAELILQTISNFSDDELTLGDINIIVCSLSGGTGSVYGPLLMKDIAVRRKKLVVMMCIVSSQDWVETDNTLKTLKSLQWFAADGEIYLPVNLFNNAVGGLKAVDTVMPTKIARLVDILTMPTKEVDKNDRMHWIDAKRTIRAPAGLRLLHVAASDDIGIADTSCEVWPGFENYIFDSVLSLRTERYQEIKLPKARVLYDGYFTTVKLVPMMGIIGGPPNCLDVLIQHIEDTTHKYDAQAMDRTDLNLKIDPTQADKKTGLFL